MTAASWAARVFLITVAALCLAAPWVAPSGYAEQHRDHPGEGPSAQFPLGTDDLGRDRLSRLLYGARLSLLLAPLAAVLSTMLAAVAGAVAGWRGGWIGRGGTLIATLFLSMPWMFLLLAVRALLPLNTSPLASAALTFLLLSLLGWAGPSRVFQAAARQVRNSDFLLQARALGIPPVRILWRHLLPVLSPVALAQFWLAVPLFILSEANLSLLGLGVAEPLPSLGSLLTELQDYASIPSRPWVLAPAGLLVAVMAALQAAGPGGPRRAEEGS
ncbi:MAG: ABC transporter permease [Acidobacteria bacterium]|nr:ABC transporter permease [Acidobacteriota bacterium]